MRESGNIGGVPLYLTAVICAIVFFPITNSLLKQGANKRLKLCLINECIGMKWMKNVLRNDFLRHLLSFCIV